MVAVTTKPAIKKRLVKYDDVFLSESLHMLCTDTVVHQRNPTDTSFKRTDESSI